MAQWSWRQLESFATWSALIAYYAVWVWIPMTMEVPKYDWVGWLLGAIYVAGHVYEIKYRGHCYLSADATAFPQTVLAAIVLYLVLHFGFGASWSEIGRLGGAFAISFGAGHLAAIAFGAVMTGLMTLVPHKKEE